MTTPKPKKRRKTKRKVDRRGKPPALDNVRICIGSRDQVAKFSFSHDIIDRLFELHDQVWGAYVYTYGPNRHRSHRLQFVRCADLGIPAVMVRIEPPSYDPRGSRFRKDTKGRKYLCGIKAWKLGLRPETPGRKLETWWADLPGKGQLHGLIMQFNDEDMLDPVTSRQKAGDRFNPNASDLIVR